MKGTVSWFNDCKGFGFIEGEDGESYFAQFQNIQGTGFKFLREKEQVTFKPNNTPRGKIAMEIVRGVVPPKPEPPRIKDCPCCGSKAQLRTGMSPSTGYDDERPIASVHCTKCPINTGTLGDSETAIRVWNTRPEPYDPHDSQFN